ncbi:MAG: class I SAM-dependent methyltransferase [Alphaproteobacteria bacterium]|nr:class I SAM-dependent methyltransferase [Alphaproteobacteria bacterium]MBV9371456.1 class I SAM-dependent methyltransferase [Alphaproteobacteria bacterium]MBV9902393.1 class I SAM-dependent methyltransferase [Alphaproteobacteria bacterium]
MNYPDFVGYINQWNVLPGAYSTLNEWAIFSRLGPEGRLLQFGCTTGFQARELAVLTGCTAHGLDVSGPAVDAARHNAALYAPEARVTYECGDAHSFTPDRPYTHIALGGGLRFFPNPDGIIARLPQLLVDGGCILASPFYVRSEIPQELLERGRRVFGVLPTTEGYDEVMAPYLRYEVIYESRKELAIESDEQVRNYCRSTIERAARFHQIDDRDWKEEMFDRLFEVRQTSNALRPYQGYNVLVLRYRASTYPHRYVELF